MCVAVWKTNVSHRLTYLNTWFTYLVVLFCDITDLLGCKAMLENKHLCRRPLQFIALPHLQFVSLLASSVQPKSNLPASYFGPLLPWPPYHNEFYLKKCKPKQTFLFPRCLGHVFFFFFVTATKVINIEIGTRVGCCSKEHDFFSFLMNVNDFRTLN